MKSMTGYAKVQCTVGDKKVNIEIKTLNSKALDLIVKLPPAYRSRELEIRTMLGALERGKVELLLTEESSGAAATAFNADLLAARFAALWQQAMELGASTDTLYSHLATMPDIWNTSADGEVTVLQKSTQGKGITLVLMGDGYADRDIADSTYFQTMYQAMENLFSEEPVRSLRDYFDVYTVSAVSRNSGIARDHSTVFSCIPSNTTSSIDFDQNQIVSYTKKVPGIELDRAISVVILNSSASNGVTALLVDESTKKPRQYAISACCTIDSIRSETFRQVLTHEVIGHGLAKLADEYGYEANGAPTTSTERMLKLYHQYNWMMNADTESDETLVLWNRFIGDPRFASENIGLYEGAYTYYMGVYRPTEESMMRHNESPFNAPSRKAIYDKVMELGEERPASTLEEFATFDALHKPQRWDYSTTRSLSPWQQRRPAPPIIIYR